MVVMTGVPVVAVMTGVPVVAVMPGVIVVVRGAGERAKRLCIRCKIEEELCILPLKLARDGSQLFVQGLMCNVHAHLVWPW